MLRIHWFLYFTLTFAISSSDFEYPTLINPDGTIQSREFSKEQKFTFDSLKKEIKYFQSEISKVLPYLIRSGNLKNDSIKKEIRNFIETQPGGRDQHFVEETFILRIANGKLNSMAFLKKSTRLNSKMESETIVKTISNEIVNEEMTSVKLQVDSYTNYTEANAPIRRVFSMTEIPSPRDRIKLLRAYRTKVEEALRELDKSIDRKVLNDHTTLSNTLNDIELE